ncbi:hypothetical protein [Magnetospirillum molischianum]|uniref:Uncharacterized protein n=1 Tax=Magnetospirillum molischianum DSM 120 TaxID=1150626 RepID=H8FPR5_MAGML|nr:hypothetical protein [Magnetospirillum molischianum]CCG40353.1 hypothetical protein PHAMO_20039 [Magnetospirillum molischianum DSM 120]
MPSLTVSDGKFSAAVEAAKRAAAREQAADDEMAQIRAKGFTAWVRDTQMEKLKEELRKKIMSEMGLTEEDLGKMTATIQQILEARIKEEVEKRLASALAANDSGSSSKQAASNDKNSATQDTKVAKAASTVLAAQEQATATSSPTQTEEEKRNRQGNFGMVIPALAMPGSSLL